MDVEELIIIAYLSRKKRKIKKRYWIHPLFLERHSKGLFQTYFKDIRAFPDRFFNYTRMSVQSFDNLLEKIRNSINGIDTPMRACIKPEEKLVITLSIPYIHRTGVGSIASQRERGTNSTAWDL